MQNEQNKVIKIKKIIIRKFSKSDPKKSKVKKPGKLLSMVKNQTIILKLGGSVITEKLSGRPRIREAVVQQLAKELKLFIQHSPQIRVVLLHGAGSFGHPLVYRHKLLERPLTGARLFGFTETVCSMRHMANLLADNFRVAKLPVLPIQASAVLNEKNNTMVLFNLLHLKQIIDVGFIPLLGGDMGLTQKKQAIVVSADRLTVLLAKAFPVSRIIFATDVDGVFDKFPPSGNTQPLTFLSRENLRCLIKNMNEQKSQYDVTGGMTGKLQTMLALRGKEVIIFNGLRPGGLTKALAGKSIGTRLTL